jgi:hypothetical protein
MEGFRCRRARCPRRVPAPERRGGGTAGEVLDDREFRERRSEEAFGGVGEARGFGHGGSLEKTSTSGLFGAEVPSVSPEQYSSSALITAWRKRSFRGRTPPRPSCNNRPRCCTTLLRPRRLPW